MSNLEDPRVLCALERTALAWNRSGLALIACSMFVGDIELAVAVLIMMILVPTVYSLATYMKKYKNK